MPTYLHESSPTTLTYCGFHKDLLLSLKYETHYHIKAFAFAVCSTWNALCSGS